MKIFRAVARVFAGLLFLLAGFLKLADPVGNGLVVSEYLKIIGLTDTETFALILGFLLSVAEALIGISILLGLRMKIASKALLIFTAFFTILTLYLALANPISDCGCFGEAFKLTHWETFFKNIALLAASLIIYFQRDKFIPVAPATWEWGTVTLYTLLLGGTGIFALRHLPLVDFTPFHTGTDLVEELARIREPGKAEFITELIYEKEGKREVFTIDEVPDSSWTFIDSRTISGSVERFPSLTDFAVADASGNYVTDSLLSLERVFITVIPHIDRLSEEHYTSIKLIHNKIGESSIPHLVLCGTSGEIADSIKRAVGMDCQVFFTDFKTLITLNRSNGGVVYMAGGVIGAKWSLGDFTKLAKSSGGISNIENADAELLSAERRIKETLTAEISILFILLLIVLMRYIFRFAYKHNMLQESAQKIEGTLMGKELIMRNIKDLQCSVEWRQSLKDKNTLGLDVCSDWYAAPSTEEELIELFSVDELNGMERLVIGSGSNILFKSDFGGIVIHPAMVDISVEGDDEDSVLLRAGAGVEWDYLVRFTVDRGWGGLENLSLIPGCVGASPVQNIGAYGAEAADSIKSVRYFDTDSLQMVEIEGADCKFGYRDSIFKRELKGRSIITSVLFKLMKHPVINGNYSDLSESLSKIENPGIADIREIVCRIRESKLPDPKIVGNAGSFFKNPVISSEQATALKEKYPTLKIFPVSEEFSKVPAAWLIDQCGFKGMRRGNIGVHENQALVLLAFEGAKGKELLDLADEIRSAVKERFNIDIEPEVNIV
ncbi:MAG: UDP-N-acetylmuramate dehydrogenase [Bacteroidales bacterium]